MARKLRLTASSTQAGIIQVVSMAKLEGILHWYSSLVFVTFERANGLGLLCLVAASLELHKRE